MALTNLPGKISEVADSLEADDELFNVYDLQELKAVAPFDGMKPGPENFPGSMILRRCKRGRVLCRQGEEGATAFQILSRDVALQVLRALLRAVSAKETAFDQELEDKSAEIQKQLEASARETAQSVRAEIARLQRRNNSLLQENTERRQSLERETERLQQTLQTSGNPSDAAPREVANARLLIPTGNKRKGLLHRLLDKLRGRNRDKTANAELPEYIPNDGPQDLNINTLSAPMFEGDLFGEMSCMNLAPRSATVIATEGTADDPVYMIEMVRNALDALRGNAEYRKRMDQIYRSRVMETQVRSLPLFRALTDEDYKWLAERLELVEFEAGDVIFDEHDSTAESCYVVRTGVVKVSQNLGCLLGTGELHNISLFCRELAACSTGSAVAMQFWSELTAELRELIGQLVKSDSVSDKLQIQTLRQGMNKWMQTSKLHSALAPNTDNLILKSGLSQYATLFEDFQEKTSEWWELEVRIFNRVLLESFCPNGIQKRALILNNRRTLSYAGRGEIIGEIAVLCSEDRSATCLAFTHPSSGQKAATQANLIPQRVEAVRISGSVLQELRKKSEKFRQMVDEIVETRRARDRIAVTASANLRPGSQTKEFDALGLAWGQSLMVIDLDRCTRCQECVKACVNAHDDGRTRLYLDGPRFQERYLIPVTCRKCLDPVCMIGCPVGAINRGSGGEIQIADHCIGCSKCADQCPYGSIQMDLLDSSQQLSPELSDLLGPGYSLRPVQEKAVVCDQCSSTPSGQPSCVYACPHDAAIRVEGLVHFNS